MNWLKIFYSFVSLLVLSDSVDAGNSASAPLGGYPKSKLGNKFQQSNNKNVLCDIQKFIKSYLELDNSDVLEKELNDDASSGEIKIFRSLVCALQMELKVKCVRNYLYKDAREALPTRVNAFSRPKIIKMVQAALILNGFLCDFNGKADRPFRQAIKAFQAFIGLVPTGQANNDTLQALFASGGNKSRKVFGMDCSTQLNSEQVKMLKKKGFRYIGRYLTSKINGKQKHITKQELNSLLLNGFHVIFFFQEGMHDLDHCSAERGFVDGFNAVRAMQKLGLRRNSTIYGVIDCDTEPQKVFKYLKNMSDIVRSYGYKFGVYGSRAVCGYAYQKGISDYSYVGGISFKYKGNRGYRMPKNWAFNQEYEDSVSYVSAGKNRKISIDKVVVSGRDSGVTYRSFVGGK